ncbi:MAG: serine hydrolase domain-containing protein [Bacteroidota bacterium]
MHIKKGIARVLLIVGTVVLTTLASCTFHMPEEELTSRQQNHISRIFLADKIRQFKEVLRHSHQHYNFNGNILVARNGKVIFNDFIGYADLDTKDTLKLNSVYQLASLSKQFTAMAVIQLKERDSIDYDDKMVQYIPEFKGDNHRYYDSITIRYLLNHTSGLSNYLYLIERYKEDDRKPYNDEVIDLLAKHKQYLSFEPGTRFQYSNTGYMILALIVERVSGKRFDEFVHDNIFSPLEMNHSFVHSSAYENKNSDNRLKGYRRFRYNFWIPETQHDGVVGDKGVCAPAIDLYKWDQALYSNTLVSQEALEDIFERGKLENGRSIPYGFGFRLKKDVDGNKVAYHEGLWNGFRNGIYRYLNDTSTIIILEHTDCKARRIIKRKIKNILHSPYHNVTRILAEKAIKDGGEEAVEVYETMYKMNLEFNVNLEKLIEVQEYLREIDKFMLARNVRTLIQAVTEKKDGDT